MGKNYTLYISQPAFAVEKNKSGLVNQLLNKHYGTPAAPIKKIEKKVPVQAKAEQNTNTPPGETVEPVDNQPATDGPLTVKMPKTTVDDIRAAFPGASVTKFCNNNHIIPEGRDKCLVDGCKYSQ